MKKKSILGFTGIELAAAIVIVGAVLLYGKHTLDSLFHRSSPSAAQVALVSEKAGIAKTGQQFSVATTQEIAKAKDQSDPAIVAAKKTSYRADIALETGLGALTPAQAQWVQNLVESDAAGFTASLDAKDKEISQSGDKIAALEKKVAAEQGRSDWFENLVVIIAVIFVFVNFVLPWLEKIFPALGGIASAVSAVANPFLKSVKEKAEADLSAAAVKAKTLYGQLGQAVTDMRSKLGSAASSAIAHLDNNLDVEHADAIALAARTAAAAQAGAAAAAAAQVAITTP